MQRAGGSRFPPPLLPFSQFSSFALPIPHPLPPWDTSLPKTSSFLFSPFTPISCFHYSAFFRLLLKYANYTSSDACILIKQILFFVRMCLNYTNGIMLCITQIKFSFLLLSFNIVLLRFLSLCLAYFCAHMVLSYILTCHILLVYSSIDESNIHQRKLKMFLTYHLGVKRRVSLG